MKSSIRFSRQAGIALIIVLWITALLTVIASSFIHAMRTEINVVGNSVSRAKLEAAANAGVQRALIEISKPPVLVGRWSTEGVPQSWSFNGVDGEITIVDESGKIDINFAPDVLLRSLLRTQGVAEEEAAALVDAILDWRDADSLKRLRGAEDPEYLAAGLAYKPSNAFFLSVDELRLVFGMTPELFDKLSPHLTIYSRQGGINTQIATRDVLRALPGVTDAQVDEYLAKREAARAAKLPVPFFSQVAGFNSGPGGATSIRVEMAGTDGTRFIREAVVWRVNNPKRQFAFLRWREGNTTAPTPMNPGVDAPASANINGNKIS